MKKLLILISFFLLAITLTSATFEEALKKLHPIWGEVDWTIRENAFKTRQALLNNSPFACIPFNNVGPMAQGGRIMDLAMDERAPENWIVAFATGGVWITHDDGNNWKPIFENQPSFSIGSLGVVWGKPGIPETIWVGTGEPSNTRTVYMGAGLFKSDDQGKTWTRSALPNAHHIADITIHPNNPGIIFVAALGPVYTDGGERGLYRTDNNGKTWMKVIDPPSFTGVVEVIIDIHDPEVVYASTWERRRKAWDFRENGPGSGIWKSTDEGKTFVRLNGGLPNGKGMGRIGLALSYQNPKMIYALIDNQNPRPTGKDNPEPLLAAKFLKIDQKTFLKFTDKKIDDFLALYRFPDDFSAKKIREDHGENKFKFNDMKKHVKAQIDIPYYWPKCIGPELYISRDAGLTWRKTHKADLRGQVDWGYGTATYYFGRIAIDPSNDERLLICAVPLLETKDGGKTFEYADRKGGDVHSDHHAILFNSKNSKRVILGNDGGLYISLNGGISWRPVKNIPVGQCYTVTYDMSKPYRIFSGLQDNGISMGLNKKIKAYQQKDTWKSIWGADGMFIQANLKNNNTIILGTQFGSMSRLDLHTGKSKSIRPKPSYPNEEPFRTNWVTPIVMSKFNPDILYTGTQFVHRSFDAGDSWHIISPDLTSEGKEGSFVNTGGNVSYGNLSALAESSMRFGLIYAGTDEGWLWITKDSGLNWEHLENGIPGNKWVTRVEPSCHVESDVFATFTGFRENDTNAYVYKSTDYGKTWESIKNNLPNECMNVIRQDPVNPDLLYVGSDFGVYVSLNGGKKWESLGVMIPNVPAYDLCVQPRESDLIVGTYGRSVWIGSIKVLQEYTENIQKKKIHLFEINKQQPEWWWEKEKVVQVGKKREIEKLKIFYHSASDADVKIYLKNKGSKILRKWDLHANKGINRFDWDFLINTKFRKKLPEGRRPFILPGKYTFVITSEGVSDTKVLIIDNPKKMRNRWGKTIYKY